MNCEDESVGLRRKLSRALTVSNNRPLLPADVVSFVLDDSVEAELLCELIYVSDVKQRVVASH